MSSTKTKLTFCQLCFAKSRIPPSSHNDRRVLGRWHRAQGDGGSNAGARGARVQRASATAASWSLLATTSYYYDYYYYYYYYYY